MANKINYLIGNAHELTRTIPPPKINPQSSEIYNLQEVLNRLAPQFSAISTKFRELPNSACPEDFTVSAITLHPSYIAKGHFPSVLLREMGVESIGSKGVNVKPDKWVRKGEPKLSPTTQLFVAGQRERITEFGNRVESIEENSVAAADLMKIWSVEAIEPRNKLKLQEGQGLGYFEVGLHLISSRSADFIRTAFIDFASNLGFEARVELAIDVSNLWFLPVIGDRKNLESLATFSFVRVVRTLPAMRSFQPLVRALPGSPVPKLPKEGPLATDLRVAILDGGLPASNVCAPWIENYYVADPSADNCEGGAEHGLGVTSAFLFGPLSATEVAPRPFAFVDHHRVLDSKVAQEDPLELYRTLNHIEDVLVSREYEFINLSLGPELSIDDDDIHPWTSLLDTLLADGDTFVTVAAGNNGERDDSLGLNRVQIPSDCVNAVSVGSADNIGNIWSRAPYSAIGPGRAPGRVKPDLVAFGGYHQQYFHVPSAQSPSQLIPTQGTSFSSPYLLRKAVGIRAILGNEVSVLAIKALLVHAAKQSFHSIKDVGWGKVPEQIAELIESPDGVARILYQGELKPGKYLNVPLPIPISGLVGTLKIKATCCFATPVDPQDTSMYTKAGLEIAWRPKGISKKTESFFMQRKIATEAELRADAGKWESVLHASVTKRGTSLEDPCFEIHYIARDGGDSIAGYRAPTIKYAFLVTIEAPKNPNIFNDILSAYPTILTEIQPRISTPIKVTV